MGDGCAGYPGYDCDMLGRMKVGGCWWLGGLGNGYGAGLGVSRMEFKRVSNGNIASISYRISKQGQGNRLEIKHKKACKQAQIQQEYAKVSNAHIQVPK